MAISFLLLWVFRTQQFTGDSLWYAKAALDGTQIFHPHHLIFTPSIRCLFLSIASIGIDLTILEVGQLFNIFFAALTIGLIHRIIGGVVSTSISILIPLILLFCNGFWSFSTQIEVYIPGIFFSLLLLWTVKENSTSVSRIIIAILAFAMATLFHQTNALLAVPLILLMGKSSWKNAALICSSSGFLVLGAYLLVMNHEGHSLDLVGFTAFSLNYAVSGQEGWGTFSNLLPMGWFELFASQTGNIIRQSYSHVVFYWLIFTLAILWLIIFGFRSAKKTSGAWSLIVFSVSWIITNYLFFLWWLPKEGEFFIASLIPLSILLAIKIENVEWKYRQSILPVIFLVIVGFNGFAFYQKHSQPNEFGLRAEQLAQISDENTVVITDFFTQQYLRFFHQVNAENTEIVYRSIYENTSPELIESISNLETLIVSQHHFSPDFVVNGFSGISHQAEWESSTRELLKNTCTINQVSILEEDHWVIKRCDESPLTVDSALKTLGYHSP